MMENKIVIGVDVGGSHITSACVSLKGLKIVKKTRFTGKLTNTSRKEDILKEWSKVINNSIAVCGTKENTKLGFAMPGPFDYVHGKAKFKNNEKYQSLYNISIREELAKHLVASEVEMRFLNDATAFGVGSTAIGKAKKYEKVLALTLGTGFGAAFLKNGTPQVATKEVPTDGLLWDKPFKDSIADDYFSTRWYTQKYAESTGKETRGVKEIAIDNCSLTDGIFKEFGNNLGQFLAPYLHNFKPDVIILGGNISKASHRFLPFLINQIEKEGIKTTIEVSDLMEDAALIGASKLYDMKFWNTMN